MDLGPLRGRVRPDPEVHFVPPGDADCLEQVWLTKERIRQRDGALMQRRKYFEREYRRQRAYLLRPPGEPSTVVGFAVIHQNGYLSLFGVDPQRRREGLGTRLLDALQGDHAVVHCHTRASNEGVVSFYQYAGFTVEGRHENYYGNGDDALELRYVGDGG